MKIIRADGFGRRLIGWIGRRRAGSDEGLWLVPCRAVHTLGMRFPIDVVFIDRQGRAMRIDTAVAPWRCRWQHGAHSVLELAAGRAAALGLTVGAVVRQTRGIAWLVTMAAALIAPLAWQPTHAFAAAPLIEETLPEIEFKIEWETDPERLAEEVEAFFARTAPPVAPAAAPPPAPASGALPGLAAATEQAAPHLADSADVPQAVRGHLPPLRLTRPLARDTLERLLDEADSLYRARHWLRAMDAYRGLTEIDPPNRHAWLRIGNLHHQRNQLGAAAGAYRKAAQPLAAAELSPGGDAHGARAKALANLVAANLDIARAALDDLQSMPLTPGTPTAVLREGMLTDLRQLETDLRAAEASGSPSGSPSVRGGSAPSLRGSDRTGLAGATQRATVEYLRDAPAHSIGLMRGKSQPGG